MLFIGNKTSLTLDIHLDDLKTVGVVRDTNFLYIVSTRDRRHIYFDQDVNLTDQ